MRFFSVIPLLSLVPAVLGYTNLTSPLEERTFGGSSLSNKGSYQNCARVAGRWGWVKWDFGCICEDDVEQYCRTNNIRGEIKNAIYSHISSNGIRSFFPHNAQPTCDGRGGYTCGSLGKKSDGTCGTTNCESSHWSSGGSCCPRGQTYVNGHCCGTTGCGSRGNQCYPVYSCPSGQEFKQTQCCPTYQDEINGKCSCQWGYEDKNGKCAPKCKDDEKLDDRSNKCVPKCDTSNGWTHQKCKNNGPSICCSRGQTAYDTVCCGSGKEEINKSGVCCTAGVGAKVENGQCIEPTGKSKHPKRMIGTQINLTPSDKVVPYGLETNANGQLCPASMAACPVDAASPKGAYECLDPMSEIQSCGGCATLATGRDCTAIPGARWMGCNAGQCEVYSCKKGWKLNGAGTACERK
ncbi:hypothetical protein IAT40_002407 [Kwoniella sp. CBS 6097]